MELRTDLIEAYLIRPKVPSREGLSNFHVLQLQRADDPLKGTWHPVAGHIEAFESAAQAAIRELKEETAITLDGSDPAVRVYALQGVHPYLLANSNTIVMTPRFVCVAPPNWQPTLNAENEAHRWLELQDTTYENWLWPGQIESMKEIQQLFSTHVDRRQYLEIDLKDIPTKPPENRKVLKVRLKSSELPPLSPPAPPAI